MNLKYLLCIFFFLTIRGISFSQDRFAGNLEVVNNLIDESFTSLNNNLLVLGKDKFYLIIYDPSDPESSYLFERFKNRFYDYKLIINEDLDSIDYKIVFKTPVIKTTYNRIFTDQLLGTKKVEREISVSYGSELEEKESSKILYKQDFSKKAKDSIDLDKVSNAEDERFNFSSSNLPEESTVNQVRFPAIIIGISAAAIILFFTIRSK